jgi:hypothetical protein
MKGDRHPREEIAALALGALEPAEAERVRAHVDTCAACREELRSLAALPPLLDLVPDLQSPPIEAAPPPLEDAVIAHIDRARGERPRTRPARRRRLWLAPAWGLAGAAVTVAALAITGQLGGGGTSPAGRVVALRGADATARATLRATDTGMRVALRVSDLAPTRGDQVYELWFSRGKDRVSAGTFVVGADGRATLQLSTAVSERDARRLWITREPNGSDPAPNGPTVLRSRLA